MIWLTKIILQIDTYFVVVLGFILGVGIVIQIARAIKIQKSAISFRLDDQSSNKSVQPQNGFPKWLFKVGGMFAIGIALMLSGGQFLARLGLREMHGFLDKHRNALTVAVDGREVSDPNSYLNALYSSSPYWSHHSHVTKNITINLVASDGQKIDLLLGRDSEVPNEYWLFWPLVSQINPIGLTHSDLFDKADRFP